MIRDADSERVWDKRGVKESDPWDPPKLPSSECSLMDYVKQLFNSTMYMTYSICLW
jgi:hypothetical protein